MKRTILIVLFCGSILASKAQTLSPTVLSTTGNYSVVGNVSLSSTVGEMAAIQTFTSGNGATILTQGFQQPNDHLIGLLEIEKGADGSFSVYPNPTSARLWFGYEFPQTGKIEVSLYNIIGQKLDFTLTETYESGKLLHNFDCSAYAAGDYVLSVKLTPTVGKDIILSKKFQIIN